MTALLYLIPGIIIFLSVYFALRSFRMTGSAVKAVRVNLVVVACLFVACIAGSFGASAVSATDVAAAAGEAAQAVTYDPSNGLGMLAAALVTGVSGIGGGIAVAAGAPAAIGATSEDPKAFGKALIFVALGESIALYGLVISIMILGKY